MSLVEAGSGGTELDRVGHCGGVRRGGMDSVAGGNANAVPEHATRTDACGRERASHAGAIELELPYPPSVNRYWRNNRGVTHISKEGRDFRRQVAGLLKGLAGFPITAFIRVRIEAFPPDRRKRDIDNILKALLDALQHGGAIADDYQVTELIAARKEAVRGGRCRVAIEVL